MFDPGLEHTLETSFWKFKPKDKNNVNTLALSIQHRLIEWTRLHRKTDRRVKTDQSKNAIWTGPNAIRSGSNWSELRTGSLEPKLGYRPRHEPN